MLNKIKQKYNSAEFEPLKDMLSTTLILSLGAYCIPSVYTSIKNVSKLSLDENLKGKKYDKYEDEAYTYGITGGLAGFISQGYLYSQNLEFIAIPILTNIFSGIYEFKKSMNKNTLENKLDLY